MHGEVREYDENGLLKFEANNRGGNLDGLAKTVQGKEQVILKYKNGIVIDTVTSKSNIFKFFKKDKELSEE